MNEKKNKKPKTYHAEIVPISVFLQDSHNANLGTEDGMDLLERSIREGGIGRGVLVDNKGKMIAGNKTQEKALELGFDEAIIVRTDGKRLVVVQREDLDLDDPSPQNVARKLAYRDNLVSQLNLDWNPDVVKDDFSLADDEAFKQELRNIAFLEGIDLSEFDSGDEGEIDFGDFEETGDVGIKYRILIDNLSQDEARDLLTQFPNARMKQYREKES